MSVLRELMAAGLSVRIDGTGGIALKPASRLTEHLRQLVGEHRSELLNELNDADRLAVALVDAAMCAGDHHGDQARERMKRDCLAAPPHLHADLLDHFKQAYEGDTSLPGGPSDIRRCHAGSAASLRCAEPH